MLKIVVISTYPEHGSKNIGDFLITQTLCDCIKDIDDSVEIHAVWREDEWDNVKSLVLKADRIIFACLAIRKKMFDAYPWIDKILECGIPYSVISAGTNLPVTRNSDLFIGFLGEIIDLLRRIESNSVVFTTRGVLTQSFCEHIGLHKSTLSGDIAFYRNCSDKFKFECKYEVNRIVVSDPHGAKYYRDSFLSLLSGLKIKFPDANVSVFMHGVNPEIEKLCDEVGVAFVRLYENKKSGLNLYDEIDLHVGYRVHAHVSALKRGKVSYLLEQDGRGADYGLSFEQKMTVPNYNYSNKSITFYGLVPRFKSRVSSVPASLVLTLIDSDKRNGFKKFRSVEGEVAKYEKLLMSSVRLAMYG